MQIVFARYQRVYGTYVPASAEKFDQTRREKQFGGGGASFLTLTLSNSCYMVKRLSQLALSFQGNDLTGVASAQRDQIHPGGRSIPREVLLLSSW